MKSKHILFGHWRQLLFIAFPLLVAITLAMSQTLPSLADTLVNFITPISGTVINTCKGSGETVTFSGNVHITSRFAFDGNGGVHVDNHANFQDVSGIGDQGNKYRIPTVSNEEFNAKVGFTQAIAMSELVISQGSAPNFIVKTISHITVNANGTETVSFTNFTRECRG